MDGHTKNGRKRAHVIDTTPSSNQQYSQNPIFDDKPSDDSQNGEFFRFIILGKGLG